MIFRRITIVAVFVCLLTFTTFAQNDTCPTLVETALNTVDETCTELGRNQACYGNGNITALDFDNAPIGDFDVSGDRTDLMTLRSLATTPLDVDANLWGVALLALQADLPGTLPGQNVTFVVFGDTELTNEVSSVDQAEPPSTLAATINDSINVRSGPGTGYRIVGFLTAGDEVILTGRNEAANWVQMDFEDTSAWIYAPLLMTDGDLISLQVAEVGANTPSRFTSPMQAFRFQTGIGTPACEEAPPDGLLVQAPSDTTVHFRINGIEVEVGSTALLKLEEDERLGVNTLDGIVNVTSSGETQTAEPGFRVAASENTAPTEPELYDYAEVRTVPVELLPEPVRIPLIIPGDIGVAQWVDSEITVSAGQEYTIQASGEVSIWPACGNICTTESVQTEFSYIPSCRALCDAVSAGPGGSVPIDEVATGSTPYILMSDEPLVGLLGRVGENEPFYIGEGGNFVAEQAGTLQFRINEDNRVYGDETGQFTVYIELAQGE